MYLFSFFVNIFDMLDNINMENETLNIKEICKNFIYYMDKNNLEDLMDIDIGVTVLSPKGDVANLLYEIKKEIILDMNLSECVGEVYQDFKQKSKFVNYILFDTLRERLEENMNNLFELENKIKFDCVILQEYEYIENENKYAMPPHRDQKGFVNLVIVLLVEGESNFYIAKDKSGLDEKYIDAKVGDLIVMRGYDFMNIKERPIHYVGKIQKGKRRVTLGFRQFTKDEKDLENIKNVFNYKI